MSTIHKQWFGTFKTEKSGKVCFLEIYQKSKYTLTPISKNRMLYWLCTTKWSIAITEIEDLFGEVLPLFEFVFKISHHNICRKLIIDIEPLKIRITCVF